MFLHVYSREISARGSSANNIMIIRSVIIKCAAKWNGKSFRTIEMETLRSRIIVL